MIYINNKHISYGCVVDCKCLATHFVSLHSHPRTASHNVPYPYNHKVPYPYNNNVSYSYNHNFPIFLQSQCPISLQSQCPIFLQSQCPIFLQSQCPIFLQSQCPIFLQSQCPIFLQSQCPISLQSKCPIFQQSQFSHITTIAMSSILGFGKKIGLYKSYKLILLHVRINCILKKQRCLCNSKIKFQIPPLAGKNLIELFS